MKADIYEDNEGIPLFYNVRYEDIPLFLQEFNGGIALMKAVSYFRQEGNEGINLFRDRGNEIISYFRQRHNDGIPLFHAKGNGSSQLF